MYVIAWIYNVHGSHSDLGMLLLSHHHAQLLTCMDTNDEMSRWVDKCLLNKFCGQCLQHIVSSLHYLLYLLCNICIWGSMCSTDHSSFEYGWYICNSFYHHNQIGSINLPHCDYYYGCVSEVNFPLNYLSCFINTQRSRKKLGFCFHYYSAVYILRDQLETFWPSCRENKIL